MIQVNFNPKEMMLEVTGHADYAENGKDIVCAAMSILFYQLADSLTKSVNMLEEYPDIKILGGECKISCKPMEKYSANIENIYWVVLNGVELLADNYAENTKFCVVG